MRGPVAALLSRDRASNVRGTTTPDTRRPTPLSSFDSLWPYLTLGAGAMIAEEAAPLLAGIAARDGRLAVAGAVAAIGGVTWVATAALYYLGRFNDRWVRRRFPQRRAFVLRTVKVVRRHPWRASLFVRWVFGLRIALPIACGAARVPQALFLGASAVSCFAWASAFTALGWLFGTAARELLVDVRAYDRWVIGGLAVATAIGWYVARKRRRRLERRAVEVIAGPDDAVEEKKGL